MQTVVGYGMEQAMHTAAGRQRPGNTGAGTISPSQSQ